MGDLNKLKVDFEKVKSRELNTFLSGKNQIEFRDSNQAMVSVILVLYNRAELTLPCLKSLITNCHIPLEIIVIDNNSSDKTSELFEKVKGVQYIKNEENINFLLACNQAADIAKGKYLLFLNNDATIRKGAIEKAIKVFQEEKDVGAVGAKIILLDGKLQEAGSIVWNDGSCLGYGRGQNPESFEYMFRREVNFCSGAFLLTPKELFIGMGKFDEAFAPAYYEETDYCISLQENGYKVFYEPGCVIDHFEFASSDKQSSAIKLQQKNQAIFAEKHKNYLSKLLAPEPKNILKARQTNNDPKILFIEDRIPHEDLGAGFPRSNQIVNSMVHLGYFVTIYSLNFLQEDNWKDIYRDLDKKIELVTSYARANFDFFSEARADYYDMIWVSRPHNMEFVFDRLSIFQNVKVIYDAEAIFSDRAIEKVKITGNEIDAESVLKKEIDLADYADTVVAVKKKDAELFQNHGNDETFVLNVAFPRPKYLAPFDVRKDILFVGNMDYEDSPNVDSLIWFIENVFSVIQEKIGDVKLHLVGTNNAASIQKYGKQNKNIILHGRLDDLTEIYNASKLFIAPTRYAAGSPAKVFMAAAYGIPVVATDLIISQVGWKKGHAIDGCHFDEVDNFIEICCKVYTDEKYWLKLSTNALNKIIEQNGVEAYLDTLNNIVNTTLGITQIKRKEVSRLKIEDIANDNVRSIFENFQKLKKSNIQLQQQIKEGEKYVLKLLEEISNKNTEIELRGKIIQNFEKNIIFRTQQSIKKILRFIARPFRPVVYYFKNFFRLLSIFLKNPINSFKYFNGENIKAFFHAINNEPLSIVLNNIAKKINTNKNGG